MVGHALAAQLAAMGEGGRLAGGEQPVDRGAGGAAAVGIELAEQLHQADPPPVLLAEPGLAGERGGELDGARAGLPAPAKRRRLLLAPPRAAAADPLGMAVRELDGVEELPSVNGLTRKCVAPCWWKASSAAASPRDNSTSRAAALASTASAMARTASLPSSSAPRASTSATAAPEARKRASALTAAPRRDRLPARALGEPRQFVAVAKGEDEERRPHCGRLARARRRANRLGYDASRLGTLTAPCADP